MSYLYEETYPKCPGTNGDLIVRDFQSKLLENFVKTCPDRWAEVMEKQKVFSSKEDSSSKGNSFTKHRSLTCVTFFYREKGEASGQAIHQEDFDFTGKDITVSNNTAASIDDDLDFIHNNIFVVAAL